ncbi:hypothetical protein ABG79_00373 [Caloramator mitchellensis]|uniref:SHOCT domain-containing protein n=1 Tax=Caloramator mitchellensis TaxID=908809 RepID=A0A0R3K2B7_CALMK|nr:SHOCT domain-containing protein [Caloramator mitchellensis]KRQ87572.1 hypothetical protein ABG79_00373 [Caloramator mitchellensis]
MFLIDILIIFALVYLCRDKFNFGKNSAAQEKLDMMLVNGEISEEDYITKKRILNEMR